MTRGSLLGVALALAAELAAGAVPLAEIGNAYVVYVLGGTRAVVETDLPAGDCRSEWVKTGTGSVERSEEFSHAGGPRSLNSPACVEAIALRLKRTDAEGSPVGEAQPSRTRQ